MENIFSFDLISEIEVQKLVYQIDISRFSALRNLSTRLLKDAFVVLTLKHAHVYNNCLDSGTFPLNGV